MATATGLQSDAHQCKNEDRFGLSAARARWPLRAFSTGCARACVRGCGERSLGVWRSQSKRLGTVGLMVLVSHEDVDLATRCVRSAAHTRVKARRSRTHRNPSIHPIAQECARRDAQ